ncbi:DNA phosphorothioation system sulfurtransferase DndC [Pontibacter sp. G13]|uniref:DNA phosphorothioation system sulfurtransferase DndC n=1 Tax=Pontibacter sp. G13 TaxID=3074898 RepID=UPI00288A82B3|nr:DNA phosphorothioation system sulfurtransferase DndC [Pontibacter sp. G13]WNJ17168.1 DNA phosphorothioation system sulfurtransferase DndC [Pontibacter sp. G13]
MAFDQRFLLDEMKEQYLACDNNRPWIVAFSGGKDSTTLLQLLWYALQEIDSTDRKRQVYIICNNTLVENPSVLKFVEEQLSAIQKAATDQGMPFIVDQTRPRVEDSFWVNLIGKGYPAPNNMFRWCTERLKINPTTRYIQEKISDFGEVIILMGTRSAESSNRAKSIKKYEVKGQRLRNHVLPNAKTFPVIKDMTTEEVWIYLQSVKNPWTGRKNRKLITLYRNGSGGDCPLVLDKSTPSCGNSRFGCWVCTVVKRDKSMEALIDNGEDWMIPLMEIRDFLSETIDRESDTYDPEKYRMPIRRNKADGLGPYWPKWRKHVLTEVLKAQRLAQQEDPDIELISYQELVAIQVIWHRDYIYEYDVSDIFNEVYENKKSFKDQNVNLKRERELLKEVCIDNPEDVKLINNLLKAQKNKMLLVKKQGLQTDLEDLLQEYVNPTFTKLDNYSA